MAQVMRYHQWPVTGKGSNTYTPDGYFQALTVDFSKTTYDWKNMTETYSSLSTATEKKCCSHVNVSLWSSCEYGLWFFQLC